MPLWKKPPIQALDSNMTIPTSRDTIELHYQTIKAHADIQKKRGWLTLLNGYSRPLTDFRSFAKYAAERGFDVLTLDARGSGKTTFENPFSAEDLAYDVMQLWEHLNISSADSSLLGVSMGGVIAQIIASKKALKNLCLVSTYNSKTFAHVDRGTWPKDLDKITLMLNQYFHENFIKKNAFLIRSMAKGILANATNGTLIPGSKAQREALLNFNPETLNFQNTTQRVLIMHGREDKIISEKAVSHLMRRFEGHLVETKIIEECGHLLLAEAPKKLFEITCNFLKEEN